MTYLMAMVPFAAIPKPIRIFPLLAIPPLVVLVALVYSLWRVRVRQRLRGIASISALEAA